MIEVEVRLSDGAFHRAFIRSINTDSLILCFENDWQTQQQVSYNSCRLCPSAKGSLPVNCSFKSRERPLCSPTYAVGDIVEAWIAVNIPGVNQPVHAWHECRLESIRSEFVVISKVNKPDSKDIIAIDEMRPINTKQPLDPKDFKSKSIHVPEDMQKYVSSYNLCQEIEYQLKDSALCEYDEANGLIVVTSPYRQSLGRVELLNTENFWRDIRHKIFLQTKAAQQNQLRTTNNNHLNEENFQPGDYVDMFKVPSHLMGLVIGTKGANIAKARKMSGVKTIIINEGEQSTEDDVSIKIVADNEDSASYARAILEYLEDTYDVPSSIVGVVIGKHGVNIEEIVKRSGVIRISVGTAGDREQPNGDYPVDSATSSLQNSMPPTVPFHFLGTAEAIGNAKFMLEMSIKSHQEIEALRENLLSMRAMSSEPQYGNNFDYSYGGRTRGGYLGGRGRRGGRGGTSNYNRQLDYGDDQSYQDPVPPRTQQLLDDTVQRAPRAARGNRSKAAQRQHSDANGHSNDQCVNGHADVPRQDKPRAAQKVISNEGRQADDTKAARKKDDAKKKPRSGGSRRRAQQNDW